MAFKPKKQKKNTYRDIESLFRDLTSRKIETLYSHQADILRSYSTVLDKKNIAIELPTGSGKTLVGLLIAHFRRHNNGERVVYLCPTKQLVNQVVTHATESYGIKATAFLGSKSEYSPASKSEYNNSETIAVTTYSSLFNVNPFFKNPDLIIVDDAHASENYISSPWSLKINRNNNEDLFLEIVSLMQKTIPTDIYNRLIREDADNFDKSIVELLSLPSFYELKESLIDLLNLNIDEGSDTWYSWKTICNNRRL